MKLSMKFKYKKIIYIGSFSAMLLGMLFFSTLRGDEKKEAGTEKLTEVKKEVSVENKTPTASENKLEEKQETKVEAGTEEKESAISPEPEVEKPSSDLKEKAAVSNGPLKKDAYPEVNQLIKDYFKAKIAVDKKGFEDCVDNLEYAGFDKLREQVKEIESIDNIICYTIDGPEEESYITYVYSEVKFKEVSIKPAAIDGFYIRRDSSGRLKIILSPLSSEIQKIIDEDSKREDVAALISDVNRKVQKDLESDSRLSSLLQKMSDMEKAEN